MTTTTSSPSTASTASTGLYVRALFERYAAAWAARDPDAIMTFHAEDTQFWLHIDQPPAQGREAVRAAFAEVFEQWPEFGSEIHRVLVGADHWVLDWTATAVLTDPDGTRRPVRVDCLDVVCVDAAGLVTRKDTFPDYPQALRAVTPT